MEFPRNGSGVKLQQDEGLVLCCVLLELNLVCYVLNPIHNSKLSIEMINHVKTLFGTKITPFYAVLDTPLTNAKRANASCTYEISTL